MASCNNKAPCGDDCGRQDAHGGDCDCKAQSCVTCNERARWPRQAVVLKADAEAIPAVPRFDWIQTYTGRAFFPLDPRIEDVVIDDIAHALSCMCRFTGHTRKFYSVAQHSVLVSLMLPGHLALKGLLHDASEAYLLDLARPVKYDEHFKQYRVIEAKLTGVIDRAFGVDRLSHESADADIVLIKATDNRMLATERRDLMAPCPKGHKWKELPEPFDIKITPWTPARAKRMFMDLARTLMPRDNALGDHISAWGSLAPSKRR